MPILWQILFAFSGILILICYWKRRGLRRLGQQLKCDLKAWPIIGHTYLFLGTNEDRMNTLQLFGREAIKHGGLTVIWQVHILCVVVADPIDAELILKTCLQKHDVMKTSRNLIGDGSIYASVPKWRPRRKISTSIFGAKTLNRFVDIFSLQSSLMVDQLQTRVGMGSFSIWKYVNAYTMDSVCMTALGVSVGAQKHLDHPVLKAFNDVFRLIADRICQPWLYNDFVYKLHPSYRKTMKCVHIIWNFVEEIVKSKRNVKITSENDTQEIKCFLELLIDASGGDQGFSNKELREEVLVMALAGTDTSAVAISFTAVMLSRHPDMQDRIFEELKEVFGDSDRPLVSEDLPQLKYLEAVIKETMRLYPPVPVIMRQTDKDVTLPSGTTLVKGCAIMINIWAVCRNPRYWGDDAEQFRPERFLDTPLQHPAAFMPFSYGPRNCVGLKYAMMSMKTVIATLLRRYRILPPTPDSATASDCARNKNQSLRVSFDIMMKDLDNFPVQLEARA